MHGMDYLWTPWRYQYVSTADKKPECVLCEKLKTTDDRSELIIYRGEHCYVMLNLFPYTSGHVMVSPYAHVDRLAKLEDAASRELIALTQRTEKALEELYHPDGVNIGMNIGKAAGAGVAGHIHMHVLPRWMADANFMTVVGETRVLPELLEITWERLKSKF